MTTETPLVVRTFQELFRSETLPSGNTFKLMPDTVKNGLALEEQDHPRTYMKKALQVHAITRSIGDIQLHEEDSPGVELINGLLDTDVIFLSLAWTAQMDDVKITFEEPVPCPFCSHGWTSIDFGDLKVMCREHPISGSSSPVTIDVGEGSMPKSMGTSLIVQDPTWEQARRHIPEAHWGSLEHVKTLRALTSVLVKSSDGNSTRRPSMKGELHEMRMKVTAAISDALEVNVPHIDMQLDLTCDNCARVSHIPFGQGV
jgi:hypothetical protein